MMPEGCPQPLFHRCGVLLSRCKMHETMLQRQWVIGQNQYNMAAC